MTQRNIFAYTETKYNRYPAFVSLNERSGRYFLTVRTRDDSFCSEIEIPAKELHKLESAIFEIVASKEFVIK